MDPCIVDYSVEIPTTCSFVIEFIIPKFFKVSKLDYSVEIPTARSFVIEFIIPIFFFKVQH